MFDAVGVRKAYLFISKETPGSLLVVCYKKLTLFRAPAGVLGKMADQDNDIAVVGEGELANTISDEISQHPSVLALVETNQSFIITDCRMAGNPIVYASQAFLELTGYPAHRVLGRNCRFLQGPGTDPVIVARIRRAVENGEEISIRLLNYRCDGSTFWNHLLITPIKDLSGNLINFVGVQCEVPARNTE